MGKFNVMKPQADDKKVFRKKARHFLFTQNDTSQFKKMVKAIKRHKTFRFGIACLEKAPKTGHLHIHLYCQFTSPTSLNNEALGFPHFNIPFGTPCDCVSYIQKLKKPWLRGKIIWKEGRPLLRLLLTVQDAIDLPEEDVTTLPIGLYRLVKEVKSDYSTIVRASELRKDVEIFYFWGESGSLKSSYAIDLISKEMGDFCETIKYVNGYWIGCKGKSDVAFFDEFRSATMPAAEFINLIDYNAQLLNIKRDHIRNRYKKIVITSAEDPARLYEDEKAFENRIQWLRRMHVVHFWYDKKEDKYKHQEEEYRGDFLMRTTKEISYAEPTIWKHADGALFTDTEIDELKAKIDQKKKEKDEAKSKIIDLCDRNVKEKEAMRTKKKIEYSQAELQTLVLECLKKPIDGDIDHIDFDDIPMPKTAPEEVESDDDSLEDISQSQPKSKVNN